MENLKRVGDILPPKVFLGADRVEIKEVIDKDIIIKDFTQLWGEFGVFDVVLFSFAGEEAEYTFPCGGKVVMEKVEKLKKMDELPVLAKLVTVTGRNYQYFDLE